MIYRGHPPDRRRFRTLA